MKNNTLIFGDSYSTFEGFVPDGYWIYYSEEERPETDVTQVSQTWWHQVIHDANLNLVMNNSWSGSTVGYTGYNNTDCSKSSSFIYRLKQLIESDFFEKNQIDTVFVFGGTNDSWSNAPLGEIKYSEWQEADLYFVLPAVCYFLNIIKQTLPQASIYCMINTEIKTEIACCMKDACAKYNIVPITFNSIDKKCGHPTVQGMKDIKESVLSVLNKKYDDKLDKDFTEFMSICTAYTSDEQNWYDVYKKLDLAQGELKTICDDDQDMLLITYDDGMQIDVGYIEEDKTYYITVVKDDTMESWNNPLGVFSTNDKSKLPNELQKAIHKFRNI